MDDYTFIAFDGVLDIPGIREALILNHDVLIPF
jgi:hypothetical protein